MSLDFDMHDDTSVDRLLQRIDVYEKKLEQFNLDPADSYRDSPTTVECLFAPNDHNLEHSCENRPCFDGTSTVHVLRCGHAVYTDEPTFCGRTCKDTKYPENTDMRCGLCFIWNQVQAGRSTKTVSKFMDLILPGLVDPALEHADWIQFQDVVRPAEPAYLDGNGYIFTMRTLLEIAQVRVLEKRREARCRETVTIACNAAMCLQAVHTKALEVFDKLAKSCGQLFETETLVPLSILIATKFEDCWHEDNAQLIACHTKAEVMDIELYQSIALGVILDQEAYKMIQEFRASAPSNMKVQIAEVAILSYKIWMLLPTVFDADFRLEYLRRIVASCINVAMAQHALTSSIEQACETVGCSLLKGMGDSIDMGIEKAVSAKQQLMEVDEGSEEDERIQLKMQFLQRQEETGGLDSLLGAMNL